MYENFPQVFPTFLLSQCKALSNRRERRRENCEKSWEASKASPSALCCVLFLVSSSRCRFFFFSFSLLCFSSFTLKNTARINRRNREIKREGARARKEKWSKWKLRILNRSTIPSIATSHHEVRPLQWRRIQSFQWREFQNFFIVDDDDEMMMMRRFDVASNVLVSVSVCWGDEKYFVKMFCGCVCYYYGSQSYFSSFHIT